MARQRSPATGVVRAPELARVARFTPRLTRTTGADADLAAFDAARVIDRATFENPAHYAEGMVYVLVNGVPVVRNGSLVEGVAPGGGGKRLNQDIATDNPK